MDELIFFAIIAFFTILEGIARGKKKREREANRPVPEELEVEREVGPRGVPERAPAPPPTDEATRGGSEEDYVSVLDRPRGKPPGERPSSTPSSSEGLIPADIWEEITALARGEVPTRPAPPVPAERPRPVPRPRRQERPAAAPKKRVPARGAEPRRAPEPHRLHATHPKLGRPVQERLTRLDTPADHRTPWDPDLREARAMLSGGRSALRRAVILSEVLGPPVSMRPGPADGES